ncbi:TusA-related sulfurtransferase [Natronincola peptidivorans]|uniref:TusA-related sulfurtransferase n=1 Tax=Natronincola peptidivorans TaxID=426128 RepID=A0A1I0GR42_9FIRM|nr:sulfurtransferase TusA family protein [Natronincola peptidivorans]SET73833.1 TusA-related sulfurtransferase [Natronincola peptidivorans]
MSNIVDARGRSCPEPVVMTGQAVAAYNGETIEVLVDSMVAVENIKRFAGSKGFEVEVKENDEEYSLLIKK